MSAHRSDHDLPNDPHVDAAWREASREEPPAALDAAILAAARRAVLAGPKSASVREATRPQRAWWPLAAAASIGAVAFGILQLTGPDNAGAPSTERAVVSDTPRVTAPASPAPPAADTARATVAAPPPTTPVPASPAKVAPSQPAQSAATRERRDAPAAMKDAKPQTSAATEAMPPRPAEIANDAVRAQRAAPAAEPAASGGAAMPFPAAPPAALGKLEAAPAPPAAPQATRQDAAAPASGMAARSEATRKAVAPLSIDDWLVRIRKLRAEGRTEEFTREIAAFRAAYPNEERRLTEALAQPDPPRN